jgi:WD40 repeat protein
VLRVLVEARLVTTGEGTVEVAHEALIRHWPTLREWLDDDREGRLIHRRLTEAAQEWETLGGDPETLYRGARLAAATEWAACHDDEMNELERTFLAEGRQASERDADRQRRINRRLRGLLVGAAAFLVVALAAGGLALVQRGNAREEATRAELQARVASARELASAAVANLDVDPERSILLALEGVDATWEVDRTVMPEAEEALHRALQESRILLTAPQGYGVAMSSDGSRFAAAGADGTATVWQTDTGDRLLTLRGHEGAVNAVAFTPDGSRLATTGVDRTVRLWDGKDGRQIHVLRGHRAAVLGPAFSPDGKVLATTSDDATVRIWDVRTGRQKLVLKGPAGEPFYRQETVLRPAFSPDGSRLASGGWPSLPIWDLATGEIAKLLSGGRRFGSPVATVAFSPDGRRIATGIYKGVAQTWDVKTGRSLTTFSGHVGEILSVAYSPDGGRLATASNDATARVWDVTTGEHLVTLAGHGVGVREVTFTPEGNRLLTGGADGTARLWSISRTGGRDWLTVSAPYLRFSDVAFSPDGKTFAVPNQLSGVAIRSVDTGRKLITLKGHDATIASVVFTPDGTKLAGAAGSGQGNPRANRTVVVWDLGTGEVATVLAGHEDQTTAVAVSPDGRRFATASYDGTLRVWDAVGEEQRAIDVGSSAYALDFSPDRHYLVSGDDGDTVAVVWDAKTLERLGELRGHADVLQDIAFLPGGKVVTASFDGTAKIWDLESRRELATLRGHAGPVMAVSVNPDGTRVATASSDGTAKLWDAATGRQVLTLHGHDRIVLGIKFSPDGRFLATASGDGTVALHLLPIAELRELARERVTRSLTLEECLHVAKCPAGS